MSSSLQLSAVLHINGKCCLINENFSGKDLLSWEFALHQKKLP